MNAPNSSAALHVRPRWTIIIILFDAAAVIPYSIRFNWHTHSEQSNCNQQQSNISTSSGLLECTSSFRKKKRCCYGMCSMHRARVEYICAAAFYDSPAVDGRARISKIEILCARTFYWRYGFCVCVCVRLRYRTTVSSSRGWKRTCARASVASNQRLPVHVPSQLFD